MQLQTGMLVLYCVASTATDREIGTLLCCIGDDAESDREVGTPLCCIGDDAEADLSIHKGYRRRPTAV